MLYDMRQPDHRRGLRLRFQPIVHLRSSEISGAEAIAPAPDHGAGRGEQVLRLACFEAAAWHSGCVAVNVSAKQLQDGAVLRQVSAALDGSGLAPERLELEFEESLLHDIDLDTLLTLSVVRDMGVGVVLDDFGTGAASLRMLKRLPLTGLKLDVSLLRSLPEDVEDAAIARAVIAAAHALGFTVTACGLERERQRAALEACGCDSGQGPLFAPRPDAVCGGVHAA